MLTPSPENHPSQSTSCLGAILPVERLVQTIQDLSLARSLEQIMAVVRRSVRELLQADGTTFILRDGNQCFYADEDAIAPLWKGLRFPINTCIGGWVMDQRQSVAIEEIQGDERIPYEAYRQTFVKSLAMVPIRTLQPIGAIGAYWAELHLATAAEMKLLQAIADTTAVAMESVELYQALEQRVRDRTLELELANQKLVAEIQERVKAEEAVRRLSLTDELTSLYNRRGFFLLAEQQLRLSRRMRAESYLLFADLDGLKGINDTFGHDAGDRAIIQAANILRHTFQEADIIARLGGDEFAVLVTSSLGGADAIQSRLVEETHKSNQNSPAPYPISMSIGMEACHLIQSASLEDLVTRADAAMYLRKRDRKEVSHR